jgi:hypothetical protein
MVCATPNMLCATGTPRRRIELSSTSSTLLFLRQSLVDFAPVEKGPFSLQQRSGVEHRYHVGYGVQHIIRNLQPDIERGDQLFADIFARVGEEVFVGAQEYLAGWKVSTRATQPGLSEGLLSPSPPTKLEDARNLSLSGMELRSSRR